MNTQFFLAFCWAGAIVLAAFFLTMFLYVVTTKDHDNSITCARAGGVLVRTVDGYACLSMQAVLPLTAADK